ncbi:TrkH family potassium uptake protein [Candidatus Sumerlaeota bacterium]|nr:TrkH family potassium uptake protein [Candidatus Sumerlaeota bacterium]
MNFFAMTRLLGLLIAVIGATMFLPVFWALYFNERVWSRLFLSSLITLSSGGVLFAIGSLRPQKVFRKEAIAVVGLGWLLSAGFGALPFVISGAIPHYVDAFFETMSGFTTTGSTILADIERLPRSVLFWRSFTHWLGGMGIVVLFIAILPFLGVGGRFLYYSEVPGLVPETLTPRIKETAAILWKIYLGFTVAETTLLMFCGLNLYEALCHTFGTLATGGFSTKNASIAHFDSVFIEVIIITFMFLAGTNFSLHFRTLRRKSLVYFKDPEWRAYSFILLAGILLMTINLWLNRVYSTPLNALRYASFQVVSIMTTTGFSTADFNQWTPAAKTLLVVLMFIGACAGSTGGAIKVIRWLTMFKIARYQLEKIYRPRTIRKLKIGNTRIDSTLQLSILNFFFIYVLIFILGTLIVSLFNVDLISSASSVAATLNNIGPGLEKVGPIQHYAHFPYPVKVLLSLFMVMGRLELFSILVLVMPSFWRS